MASPAFYGSPAWKALRLQALRRDRFRCTICGAPVHKPGSMRVDHIQPVRTHPHLALSLDNLRTLCAKHDNQRHREKGAKNSLIYSFDAAGMPIEQSHHWWKRTADAVSESFVETGCRC